MDMIILNSDTEKISYVSGASKEVTREEVEAFSFKEDPSVEQLLCDEYNEASEKYAAVISEADEKFLEKKQKVITDFDKAVQSATETLHRVIKAAGEKKHAALEEICKEKEDLLKLSSEAMKIAKGRLDAYRNNVKKLQEYDALKNTFEEETLKEKQAALKAKAKATLQTQDSVILAVAPASSGAGKLKF